MEKLKKLDRKRSIKYLKDIFQNNKTIHIKPMIPLNIEEKIAFNDNYSTKKEDYFSSIISENHQLTNYYQDHDLIIKDKLYHSELNYKSTSSTNDDSIINEKSFKKLKKVGRGGTANIYLLSSSNQLNFPFLSFFTSPFWKKKNPSLLTTKTTTNQVLAIKRYHPYNPKNHYETESEYNQKLLNEFYLTKKLKDQHIVQVYDLFKDKKNRWCILMEYYFGGDLLTILHYKQLNTTSMDCLFKQLLRGISYLHLNGIAHRDIKPDNLLMTTNGVLKIIDFGLAKFGFDHNENEKKTITCHSLCGSTPYWPPELFNSLSFTTSSSIISSSTSSSSSSTLLITYDALAMDIWSTAITWYCLLYKQIPFLKATVKDSSYSQFYYQYQTFQHWHALDKCDPFIQKCILNMLNPNPKLRWSISQCLNSDYVKSIEVCHDYSYIEHRHHFTCSPTNHLLPPIVMK